MAIELATAYVSIVPSTKGMKRQLSDEMSGLDSLGEQSGKGMGSKLASGFVTAAKVTATAGAAAITGALGTALVKGFGRLSSIENAKAALAGLGHSAESVQTIMDSALSSVKGTAFGLDEAAKTAAGAVAAGVQPGEQLTRILKLTGDAATIAGTSMGEMGAIFNKVATSNKLQGEVIAQLNDRGIPIIQMLSKSLGVSTDQVLELSRTGKIGFAEFSNAMEQGLGGAALKSGDTTTGAFKNMMAAVSRFGAGLLKGVYPIAKEVFGGITTFLDNLSAKVGPTVDRVSQSLVGVFDIITKGKFTGPIFGQMEDSKLVDFLFKVRDAIVDMPAKFEALKAKVAEFFKSSNDQSSAVGWDRMSGIVAKIGAAVAAAGPAIASLAQSFAKASASVGVSTWNLLFASLNALAPIIDSVLVPGLGVLAGFLADNRLAAQGLVVAFAGFKTAQVGGKLVEDVSKIGKGLSAATDQAKGFVSAVASAPGKIAGLAAKVGSGAKSFLDWSRAAGSTAAATAKAAVSSAAFTAKTVAQGVATKAAAVAQGAFNAVMAMNPIVLVVLAIAALIAGLVLAYQKVGWFRDAVDAVGRWLADTFGPILSAIGSFLGGAFKTAVEAVGKVWTDVLWPALQAVGGWIADTLWPILQSIGSFIADVFVAHVQALVTVWTGVLWPALQAVGGWIGGTLWPILQSIGSFVGQVFVAHVQALASIWTDVLWPGVQAVVGWISDNVIPVIMAIGSGIATAAGAVGSAIGSIVGFLGDLVGKIASVGATMWDGLKAGVVAVKDWIGDRIGDIVGIITGIGDRISSVADVIRKPFLWAFDKISEMWNNTIGKLSFTIPDWVPGIGGNTIAAPKLPRVKFHEGGTVDGRMSGDEVVARLLRSETVLTDAQLARLAGGIQSAVATAAQAAPRGGDGVTINVERLESPSPERTPRELVRAALMARAVI